ncbi:MAG TPA: phosphoenolpyruvate-utilizing N-terminal domain-containing protein, partial [Anaerolineae bacterium]|nr:phosphoenolpyruvate-utilizing N-terminal domain-containing protein [Anaerolineae bacterium]
MKTLEGIAASPGIAIGDAFQFQAADLRFERRRVDDPAAEWRRFEAAAATAAEQLAEVCDRATAELGPEQAAIFQAHLMMLEDPELRVAVQTAIEEQGLNAEAALSDAAAFYAEA